MSKLSANQVSPESGGSVTISNDFTATSGTFNGSVDVSGSLTYDDVTNVDSIGVITARNGIQVPAGGINVTSGVVTATSFVGDGSALTGVTAGGERDFVASGTIPTGATVVINTDGTVGIVTQTTSNTPGGGSATIFNSGTTNDPQVAYDSTNQKVVVVYSDDANSGKGTAIVGTVSGTSISFGTEVIFNNANTPYLAVAFNSTNGKVVVAYRDQGNNDDGTARVGTVSGTSISFGTATVFKSNQANYISMASGTVLDGNKVAITYQNGTNSARGECVIGTISGTGISFGTPVAFESNTTYVNQTI